MDGLQIKRIVAALTKVTEKVVVKLTLDATANFKQSTPVDTGWARANWVPKIGSPFITNLVNTPATTQGAASAGSRQASAIGSIQAYRLPMGAVFVSNNVPYITELNNGSSRQEPAGFVQRGIQKAVTTDIRGLA